MGSMTPLERAVGALGQMPDPSGITLREALESASSAVEAERMLHRLTQAVLQAIWNPSDEMAALGGQAGEWSDAVIVAGDEAASATDVWWRMLDALRRGE